MSGKGYLNSIVKLPPPSISVPFIILLHCSLDPSIRRFTIPPLISPRERFHSRKPHPRRIKSADLGFWIRLAVPKGRIWGIIFAGFAGRSFFFSVQVCEKCSKDSIEALKSVCVSQRDTDLLRIIHPGKC